MTHGKVNSIAPGSDSSNANPALRREANHEHG